jgi:cytochrome c oxidase subunit 2
VQKGWSVLFGLVLLASFGIWAAAPFVGWWLPAQVSTFGDQVDFLYYVILGFTAFFFVLTEVILVYAMWRFAHQPGRKSVYVEGNHRLEIAWTVVPAVLLLYIAFAQVRTWENIKYQSRMPPPDLVMQVTARQWEWRIRYPSIKDEARGVKEDSLSQLAGDNKVEPVRRAWAEAPWFDDIRLPNEVHTWEGANVKLYLKTTDVLHSFFLPNLRLKQDALPGKTIPMWFNAREANVSFAKDFDKKTGRWAEPTAEKDWELACAELCGGGHYRMRGRLYVHSSKEDFEAWLRYVQAQQSEHQAEKGPDLAANR